MRHETDLIAFNLGVANLALLAMILDVMRSKLRYHEAYMPNLSQFQDILKAIELSLKETSGSPAARKNSPGGAGAAASLYPTASTVSSGKHLRWYLPVSTFAGIFR